LPYGAVRESLAVMVRRRGQIALVVVSAVAALAPGSALAASTALSGSPLAVYVGDRGQLQAFRSGSPSGIFFEPSRLAGDAGFFLAFPAASPADLSGKVYGFDGTVGPEGLENYTPGTQGATTGSGTAAAPLTQVTTYTVHPAASDLVHVTQTTTYVNGSQQFLVRWAVQNTSGTSLAFKALAAADFFFDGSDRGTGVFTQGPPRFIGGTNADTGNSGGFAEALGSGSPAWSTYQALAFGSGPEEVWGKIEAAAASTSATFDGTVVGDPVDNAGGVEWDQHATSGLPNGATETFAVVVRNAVPAALQLVPSNAGAPRGVPVNITAHAADTNGRPYAGRTLRYKIIGVNPGSGSVPLGAGGSGVITDPGTNAGGDTIVAFVDFNNDGTREPVEPQASALATFVDKVAPSCKVKVTGDRPGGGGAGKPLVISVSCNESARVTVSTTLRVGRTATAARTAKRKKVKVIKLKKVTRTIAPGRRFPFKLKISRKLARKYAGRKLKATITVRAKDSSGNVKKVTKRRSIKFRRIKKRHRR
jgi:hypothetical protein